MGDPTRNAHERRESNRAKPRPNHDGDKSRLGSPDEPCVSNAEHGSSRKDASVVIGMDTPQEIKKSLGVPVENTLTSYFL